MTSASASAPTGASGGLVMGKAVPPIMAGGDAGGDANSGSMVIASASVAIMVSVVFG